MKPILCLVVCLLPVACRTTRPPSQPPAVVGAQIVEHLKRGQQDEAAAAFSAAAPYEEYREKIYPLLYEAARSRHGHGDMAGAQELLEFLNERYPKAMAVREALLYVLFIKRCEQDQTDAAALAKTDRLLKELRSGRAELPVWVELAAAQQAVDANRLEDAGAALQRFRQGWNGEPKELSDYVQELDRFLETHERTHAANRR